MIAYKLRKFNSSTDTTKPFDCGNSDLNGFLLETTVQQHNATMHSLELLSETYVAVDDNENILAYFSLLNDKIEKGFSDMHIWNRLSRKIPNAKRRSSYPAVKIGRFAVENRYQHTGLGAELISFVQGWIVTQRKTGCRFITVDAVNSAVGFYIKFDFTIMKSQESSEQTTAMFFDLKSIAAII